MTIDEAIRHCEEVADTNERICDTAPSIGLPDIYMHKDEAKKCASEHRQLAEWLKELKVYKYNESNGGLVEALMHSEAENERLHDELKAYREQSGDAISREAVLDIITFEDKWLFDAKSHNKDTEIAFSAMKSKISEIPSVTPQQKTEQQRTGRWIDDEFGSKCSCCGIYTHLDKFDRPMKFKCCSMCGAKMEEVKENG